MKFKTSFYITYMYVQYLQDSIVANNKALDVTHIILSTFLSKVDIFWHLFTEEILRVL